MPIRLNNVRLAFPQVFKAEKFQGEGEPNFTCSLILDPKGQANLIQKVKAEMITKGKEKWGAKAEVILKSIAGTDKVCLRDGNLKSEWAGFENMMYISTRNKQANAPKIYDQDGVTKLTAETGRPYGGCYVNADIEIWVQDNGFGKRINAQLRGLQFYKDGDAFSGATPMKDGEFEDISNFGEGEPEVSETSLL